MTGPTGRMLTLLSLLQTRREWPGGLLAERLEVSHRTVRRDIDRLRELGYRIHAAKGPDGGYQLEAGSELPPLLFDDDQAVALAIALQAATVLESGVEESAARALTTVRQVMPARLRNRIDAIDIVAMTTSKAAAPIDAAALVAISTAILDRTTLRFDYRPTTVSASTDDRAPRLLEPLHLISRAGRWYALGWDPERGDWRTLRVDRMTLRTHTGARFEPRELPGGDPRAFVAASFKGSSTEDRWPCEGQAILRSDAQRITPFLGDATVEDLGDGRCLLRIGSWSWRSLAAQIARFDADIESVAPTQLAEAFGELAERFATVVAAPAHP